MKRFLLAGLMAATLAVPVWADNVFVANKPFKGQVYGVGQELRFSLEDLGKALSARVVETPEGWFLAGQQVKVSKSQGVVWIDIDDLPTSVVKVVRNTQMKTLDLYSVAGSSVTPSQDNWGGSGTLVFFGASWDPLTQQMLGTVKELERSKMVNVVFIDVESEGDSTPTEYDGLFKGDSVPYFVLLDGKGEPKHSFVGFHSYTETLAILKRYLR